VLGLAELEGEWEVRFEDGIVSARSAARGLDLRWRLTRAAGNCAVTVRSFEVARGSAT
jgi:hypothetical protein